MKTVILQAFIDDSTGECGLGVKGMPRTHETNTASEGLQIAHDLIEHVNGVKNIGDIQDEMQALGAIWYVRGQFGDLRRDRIGSAYSVHENIASDLVRMFRDHVDGDAYLSHHNVPRTRACDADSDLQKIIDVCGWRGEIENESKAENLWPLYSSIALANMRIGYRKIARKYRNAAAVNDLFWAVADAVDPHCKGCDVGEEFTLRYGFRPGSSAAYAYCEERFYY